MDTTISANHFAQQDDGEQSPFDAIKRVRPDGTEYWLARDLMPLLGYGNKWQNFAAAIDRAMIAAEVQGHDVTSLFTSVSKKGAGRPQQDFEMARFAAYLTAMNGDPRKPEIAAAMAYFAVQTHVAETQAPSQLGTSESMAGMIRTLASTLLSIVDNAEPAPTTQPVPARPQATLFEVESPRRNTIDTPTGFFISDYVNELELPAAERELAARSLALSASNEYARIHGHRPAVAERWFMGKKTRGNVYTDADRPMLDALWNRRYYSIGGAA